ncbi:MAG TPA: condensation domain-containing protein, partial [Blastocatellia bacterium]
MNDFSRRVGTLSEAKRLLLELRLKEKSRDRRQSPQALTINRADRSGSLPLSFAQQRLWLIHQLDPTSCAYNIQATVRMEGPLNASLLEQSLNRVISRHESLRTSFSLAKGQLLQVIAGPEPVNISAIDLSTMPEAEREGYARRIASEQARHAFDLAEAPLLRASLIKLAEQDHIFSLTMHHIISDGWSMGILLREMVSFYNAYSSRQSPPVANLPIQYVDYAQWQRQWMRGEALAAELDYWKKKLEGAATTLELPTSKPRPPFQSFKGRVESFTLSQAFADKLRAFCRTEGVTLFMLLLAAFKLLLYRYTMREEIVVGSPVANRNRPGVEQLIGLFINTIILRTDLSGDPTFRDLLRRVREVVHEATAHQDLPFEKLVEELQPEREMSRNL